MTDSNIFVGLAAVQPMLDAAANLVRCALQNKGFAVTACYLDNGNHGRRWSVFVSVKDAAPFKGIGGHQNYVGTYAATPEEALRQMLALIDALPDPGAHDAEMDWRLLREFEERRAAL